jgi:hypothetical protein
MIKLSVSVLKVSGSLGASVTNEEAWRPSEQQWGGSVLADNLRISGPIHNLLQTRATAVI